jgi:ABC-type transport system involved in Fe-S cluster assembly fused permease/ATPase subunit
MPRVILTASQHFNNEPYEIAQYDRHLESYERSSLKIATSLALLNSGQNVIFSTGLTLIMFLAAQGVVNGEDGLTAKRVVIIDIHLLQER